MKIKRILLTGDDGYNSIGTRLLVHFLKKDFELFIAGTRDQQSAVGGHLSLKNGGTWGEGEVDGVPAFWVDGYPCDAMECMVGYHKKPFDLILSGINLGMNIGTTVISSGTYCAGMSGFLLGLAPRVMILSWNCPPAFWTQKHSGDEPIDPYLDHPGKTVYDVIRQAMQNSLWDAKVLNVNFPSEKSNKIRFTQGLPDRKLFFNYPIGRDTKTHRFFYPSKPLNTITKGQLTYDTGAILDGYIAITPDTSTLLDTSVYEKMKDTEILL